MDDYNIIMQKTFLATPVSMLAIILFPSLACRYDNSGAAQTPTYPIVETGEDYGLLRWGNQALCNNQWGRENLKSGSAHSGRVYYRTDMNLIGWEWSWPEESPEQLRAYSELIIGDKPFPVPGMDESADPRFPLHLGTVKELWFEGEIRVSGSGGYDFAFDLNRRNTIRFAH
jgi:hypothetical protein